MVVQGDEDLINSTFQLRFNGWHITFLQIYVQYSYVYVHTCVLSHLAKRNYCKVGRKVLVRTPLECRDDCINRKQ